MHLFPQRFRFQFRGIFSLIQQYGWTYISVVYLVGSYGENGFKKLQDLFNAGGVCLAAVHKVPPRLTEEEVKTVIKLRRRRGKNSDKIKKKKR